MMADDVLLKKLGAKAGRRARWLNPPAELAAMFAPLPVGVALAGDGETADLALLFVRDAAELERWVGVAIQATPHDGLRWIAYPKGGAKVGTDLNRDRLAALLTPRGFRPVAMVAIDATWAALRFRPSDRGGT